MTNRLTHEAAKTAQHVLTMCIRALDYCPPVDLTFGDYLRAIITADTDLMPDDDQSYRVAFVQAFRDRGIYPRNLRTLSQGELRWSRGDRLNDQAKNAVRYIADELRDLQSRTQFQKSREELFELWREWQQRIHGIIEQKMQGDILGNFVELTGLTFQEETLAAGRTASGRKSFELHSIRPARRRGPQGEEVNQVIIGITQRRNVEVNGETLKFQGDAP